MSVLEKAIRAIALTGDDVALKVEWVRTSKSRGLIGVEEGKYRAAFRSSGPNNAEYPLFDPRDGEQELAGWADQPDKALDKLIAVLQQFDWEQP